MTKINSNKNPQIFPSALNEDFQKSRATHSLKKFRYAALIGIVVSLALGWLDIVSGGDFVVHVWRVRISLLMVMLAVLLLTYSAAIANFYDFIVSTACIAMTIGYSGLALLSPEPIKWVYYLMSTVFIVWWPITARLAMKWGFCLVATHLLICNAVWMQLDHLSMLMVGYLNLAQLILVAAVMPSLASQERQDRDAFLSHHKQNLMKFNTHELEESESRLRFLVVLDSVTGLANRRSFERGVKMEWNRSGRSRRPVGLLRLDVDQIQALRENGGVEAIETVSMQIADIIRGYSRRSGDLAAYYLNGGFALLLADSDLNACYVVANKINKDLKAHQLSYSTDPKSRLTVSIGVTAMIPRPQFVHDEILNTAEEALRRAQSLGSEQIICL